ncbi:DUF3043 domain-containing protein [Nocardioides solisilvae]|uniref:DUF3043 domain-containing protein n=1 Tax=Nocardioides solisilvae TaxID=1542435 RepID=UPI000D743060|nr:DUF3043 domain-containing protein [Nocardioides solisilvae]
MLRRTKSDRPAAAGPAAPAAPSTDAPTTPSAGGAPETADPRRPQGKGRPTPSRKEAEAAARARAKVPRTRKELAAAKRAARVDANAKVREALKTGDERHLPARDRGPVKRFIRDFVDSRLSVVELLIPIMLVTLVMGWTGNEQLAYLGNLVLFGGLVMIVLDGVLMRFRLRRELRRRFPDAPTKGTTYYAVMRAMQMKFLRLPKAQVRIGEKLPEHYR